MPSNVVNLRERLEAAAGEPLLFAVIGPFDGHRYDDEEEEKIPASKRDVVLPWAEAAPLLDYTYDAGFGGANCHPVYAWSEHYVVLVTEYDGSTGTMRVPRAPTACKPEFA